MSTTQPIDVRDMAIVHRTFRNLYEEAAKLVRAAPAPSPERVTFLADHIDFGIAALHHRHEGEDALLYPKLIECVPEQAAVTFTQQEWDAMGKPGVAWIPRNKRGIAFGMILEPLGEADRAYMMRDLPAPVRILFPFLIERPWKKYASTLRTGT